VEALGRLVPAVPRALAGGWSNCVRPVRGTEPLSKRARPLRPSGLGYSRRAASRRRITEGRDRESGGIEVSPAGKAVDAIASSRPLEKMNAVVRVAWRERVTAASRRTSLTASVSSLSEGRRSTWRHLARAERGMKPERAPAPDRSGHASRPACSSLRGSRRSWLHARRSRRVSPQALDGLRSS
jgi:hypothetical protein